MNYFNVPQSDKLNAIIEKCKENPMKSAVPPPGEYIARLIAWETGDNRHGTPQTVLTFGITEGEYARAEVRHYLHWTEKASSRSLRICEECLGIDPRKCVTDYEPIYVQFMTTVKMGYMGSKFAEILDMRRLANYTPPLVKLPPTAPEASDHAPGIPGAL